jgi:hypothetical protein
VASLVHRVLMLGLMGLIAQQWPALSWGALLAEIGINTFAAFLLFQGSSALPGMMSRQRANRRTSLSRRQW